MHATLTERLLLRPAEVAELLSVSRTRAYELIQRGEIRAVKVGTSLRVPRAEIEAFIERLRQQDGEGR